LNFKKAFKLIGVCLLLNIITVVIAFHVLGFSISDLNSPWTYAGDVTWTYAAAQNLQNAVSINQISQMGWPYISDASNFGTIKIFEYSYFLIAAHFLGAFAVVNSYIIFSFVLVGSFTFLLFNKLKFSLLSSSMLTLMLTLLPWHFQRALWHPGYADYAVVPIFIIFLLIFTDYDAESTKHKVLKLTAILMLISTFEPYYWVFVEILLVAIFILFAITQRFSLKKNLNNLYYLGIIPFLQLIELLIQRNQSTYPLMSSPLERIYGYAEKYSGSFIALFLPSPISLIPFFSKLRLKFDQLSTLSLGEAGPWNSLLGAFAIIFCLILAIYLMITNVKPNAFNENTKNNSNQPLFLQALLISFVTSLFFYWNTGLGSIFTLLVSDLIRSWGRFFIFIIYFAVVISALVIKQSNVWKNFTPLTKQALVVTMLLVTLFDQGLRTLPNGLKPAQELQAELADFSKQLDQNLDPTCPILQLPVMKYPEGGTVGGVNDYDHFWLYLTNPNRKYSYGVVKGTQQASWQDRIETKSVAKIAAQAAAVGYCAVVVDFRAYESTIDTGNAWIKAAGKPIAISKNTRLAAFKIDPKLSNGYAQQSLVALTWKGNSDVGNVQAGKQIDFYDNEFSLYALNPNKQTVNGLVTFGVRGGKCTPTQSIQVKDAATNKVISIIKVDKNIKSIKFEIQLKSLEQKKFIMEVSSKDCTVEWYSDAKISIRNERFSLL